MFVSASPPIPPGFAPKPRRLMAEAKRFFRPARTIWLALLAIAGYGIYSLQGLGLTSVFVLSVVASVTDLGFQRARFLRLRFPDAAVATGMFLTLMLPPTVDLLGAIPVVVAAISLKHLLRTGGRPVFNPAAAGMILGAIVFGVAPAWWVAVGQFGIVILPVAAILGLAPSWRQWRLPATFLLVYTPLQVVSRWLLAASLSPRILVLGAVDPTVVFFGLLMIAEPRTSPGDHLAQPIFGAAVAVGAVSLSPFLPTLGFLVALLVGDLLAIFLRRVPSAIPRPELTRTGRGRKSHSPRWTIGARVGIGIVLFLALGIIAGGSNLRGQTPSVLLAQPPVGGGAGGGNSTGLASCQSDNPSIATATATQLHHLLGPSVLLSYDPNTGTIVFYDPVNSVTVTETDLYEDYGYAEFNGDDYAVAGCAA